MSTASAAMKRNARNIDATTQEALHTWAGQKRQVYADILWWRPKSVIGRLMEEGPGASSGGGRMKQKWEELYTGDGLIVQRIVVRMSGIPRLALTCYYLLGGRATVRDQCHALGITRAQYWPGLAAGEEAVSTALQVLEDFKPPALDDLGRIIRSTVRAP